MCMCVCVCVCVMKNRGNSLPLLDEEELERVERRDSFTAVSARCCGAGGSPAPSTESVLPELPALRPSDFTICCEHKRLVSRVKEWAQKDSQNYKADAQPCRDA